MKIMIINGPNINFTGIREPDIYGKMTYCKMNHFIKGYCKKIKQKVKIVQSNSEGKIIDYIQNAYLKKYDAIILNPGAYTHYSYAIYDAIISIPINTIEVHLSNITEREDFRKQSITGNACIKTFMGKKEYSYIEAIDYLIALSIYNK